MIKITKEKLFWGLDLLETTKQCLNSHNCLWNKRSGLFQKTELLPKNCPRENCKVVIFRKTFENSSPAFYAEALNLSRSDRAFGQLLVLAIYPLFLETKQIPSLTTAEITALKRNYYSAQIYQTKKTMEKINTEWVDRLGLFAQNLRFAHEYHRLAIIYLVYLFLKGIEKTQLPDLEGMSSEEKEEFFAELVKGTS